MKKLLAVSLLVPTLAFAAWTPGYRKAAMDACLEKATEKGTNRTATAIRHYCECGMRALETICPNEKTVDQCATQEVVQLVIDKCNKEVENE